MIAFFFVTDHFNGSPLNGKIDGDHFFVGNHGQYAPVSPLAFKRLWVWEIGTISLTLAVIPCAVVFLTYLKQWRMENERA